MFSVLLLAAGMAAIAGQQPESAETCGRCHRAIFDAWKSSAHSRAMESRLFQDALELAAADGPQARKICLGCHSPVGVKINDLDPRQKVSWEGVTCDYCHSIRDVTMAGGNPRARVEFSLVKSGPLKNAESNGHATEFSSVHTSALLCASCHEYKNSLGFPVLTTYSEWQKSSYAKQGVDCQSCHMYRVAGNVVDPKIKNVAMARVNLHQMPGSHSVQQLTKTIKAKLGVVRQGDKLNVSVDIANTGAGHYVPTGSPLRRLVLEVRADTYNGKHYREERVYSRTVADQQGKVIDREDLAFLKAATAVSDTRLAPGETRKESFSFAVPAGTTSQVRATLLYYYSPLANTEAERRVTFLTLEKIVK
jgi:hypothetical protein